MPASFDLGVWTVHASSLDANFKNGDFSTPAKVVMTRTGGDVTADRANGNYKRQELFLVGHVVMHDAQGGAGSLEGGPADHAPSPSTLTADKAQIDGQAKLYKAIGNVHYVQADTVVDADTGTLDDATHDLCSRARCISCRARGAWAQRVALQHANRESARARRRHDAVSQRAARKLATPRPLKVPKNGFTEPVPA